MTLFLSESDVSSLLEMREVVSAVEASFLMQHEGKAVNSPRTRSAVPGSVLNVMHASLPYLGRGGVKSYLASRSGTKFVFILYSLADGSPLAVMGADILGRYRTGAASAVATRHLFREDEMDLAVYGSGKQAFTQVTALAAVSRLTSVRVWSRDRDHRKQFVERLSGLGFMASMAESPRDAGEEADVGTAITSADRPFLGRDEVGRLRHLNVCGSNQPGRAELSADAVALFDLVVVDDAKQAHEEAGDLILASESGALDWSKVLELKDVVGGRHPPAGKTLFKSAGAALEDVAVASLVYDKALKSGSYAERSFDLTD